MRRYSAILVLSLLAGFLHAPVEAQSLGSSSFWETSTPEEQGLDSDLLADMLNRIRADRLRVRSVLIIRNDRLVLESYTHPYDRDVVHDVKSVSKSIISALVGIALREGILTALDQPVCEFFPEYFPEDSDPRKRKINLEHLLTMSTGLDLDENGPSMQQIMSKDDWIEAAFARPMVAAPGEEFRYCTLLTHTMSAILTRASGDGLPELSQTHLFGPLEISNVHWEEGPQGYTLGGDRLWLTPQDMAKFGYLFLNHGKRDDRQIVPEEWVREATRTRVPDFDESGYSGYGYWWWLSDGGSYRARGFGGQIVSVYPAWNMVVAFTGADNGSWETLTSEYILPALRSESPLPPNSVGQARVASLITALSRPEPQTPEPLPGIAREISARTYLLEDNELGFSDITFWFEEPDIARLLINSDAGALDLAVGMDDVYRISDDVRWGMRTDQNVFALRGSWISRNELLLDIHEVGEPFYFDVRVTFNDDRIAGSFTWQPFNRLIALNGVRE